MRRNHRVSLEVSCQSSQKSHPTKAKESEGERDSPPGQAMMLVPDSVRPKSSISISDPKSSTSVSYGCTC